MRDLEVCVEENVCHGSNEVGHGGGITRCINSFLQRPLSLVKQTIVVFAELDSLCACFYRQIFVNIQGIRI